MRKGISGLELLRKWGSWTFQAFLGFVRLAEDEACYQDQLEEECPGSVCKVLGCLNLFQALFCGEAISSGQVKGPTGSSR